MSTRLDWCEFPLPRPSRPGEPAWEVALLFPNQGHWSEEEYLALDTNRMVELAQGCLEVLPMPTVAHQLIVDFLHSLLKSFVSARGLGLVLFAPLPIRLWPGTIREPDIIYLRPQRAGDRRHPPQGADLVMEVVSEGEENRRRDLVIKRQEYARAGIPEYWIVDPQERTITVLVLEGSAYRDEGRFVPGEEARSRLLEGFAVSTDAVFAAAEAPPHSEPL